MLGELLEISIATADILAAIRFYERLGFQHAPVGETWSHPYAVLTDGRIALGLHRYDFPSPALTFVQPGLGGRISDFEQAGIGFEFRKLADDEFNEAGFYSPERQMITLLEARTYSPPSHGASQSVCGYFLEYRLGTQACAASRGFWEHLGLVVIDTQPVHPSRLQLARSGLNIALHEQLPRSLPRLVFVNDTLPTLADILEARDLPFRRESDHDGAAALRITAPDGLELLVREREY